MSIGAVPSKPLTDKQGQYLAFIHAYSVVMGRSPAEADLRRHFEVSAPSVHQMIVALAEAGWIRRTPRASRSIELAIDPAALPVLQPRRAQSIKTPVRAY
jgi:SOS-response transcriptional repressor LexA